MNTRTLSFFGGLAVALTCTLVACGGDDTAETTGSGGSGGAGTTGSGGSDAKTTGSGGGDATTGTGGSAPEVKAYGSLSYNNNTSFARFLATELPAEEDVCTQLAKEGGCVAFSCPTEVPASTYLKAGAVSAKLASQTVTFTENDEGAQGGDPFDPLTPGATITTTVAGDEVPAFEHSIKVPGAATFTAPAWTTEASPAEQTISSAAPYEVTWTDVDADQIDVSMFSVAGGDGVVVVNCIAPAADKKLTVPVAVLGALKDTLGGAVIVGPSRVDESVTASGVALKVTASHYSFATASFE